jgi:phosphate transport system protein
MASHAESAVRSAVQALVSRDYELALRVRSEDGAIDQFELEVDEQAIILLAKAPFATDLRLIMVAMKLSQNLERVGDEATQIAKRALDLTQDPPLKLVVEIPAMANAALLLLKIPQDKQIDAMNKEIHRQLVAQMVQNPDTISRCLQLMVVAKSLERIADHAKNVAEEVVYFCEARDIRHPAKPG